MTSISKVECAIIGAGVIGLAVARALAKQGREIVVLESEEAIGTGTSSRNSEVIHAGIYYPKGSLKAKLCVRGKEQLYSYCPKHGIAHNRCGKLIIATNKIQLNTLEEISITSRDNGVTDIKWLDQNQVSKLEPDITAMAALLSPSTGLIDTHSLMLAYQGEAEDRGAMIAFNSPVINCFIEDSGIRLHVGGNQPTQLMCDIVINSGGLYAQKLAASIEGFPASHVPATYYAKGTYFVP